jgi:WD40 repeat protein
VDDIGSIALSDDSAIVATGDNDGSIHLWETATGKELGRVKGHTGRVHALVFSTDGTLLFSGSQDTTILAWDVKALKKIGEK